MTKTAAHSGRRSCLRKNGQQASLKLPEQTWIFLARIGTRQSDIAEIIGIGPKTQRKHCCGKLDHAAVVVNAAVAESLFRQATSDDHPGSVTAVIFWLGTHARWSKKASARAKHLAEVMAEHTRLFGRGPVLNYGAKKRAELLKTHDM